jgi:glycolate oxidase FAD binding subunit
MVATNASGPRRVIAGACRDHLLGVRFVDGRGRILKSGGRVMKNVTGLDLGKLLCGSYGTLGVLTEVALKTLPVAPCQETIVFHDVNATEAVELFAQALATPFEVSGAAFHARTAWLRLEGLERQVSYRRDRIQALFSERQTEVLIEDKSRSLWRRLRDVEHFADRNSPLWRILVKPSDAPMTVAALESLGGRVSIDWGGGLIWYTGDAAADRVRAAFPAGHATLVRRGCLVASDMFQPASGPVASLSYALRRTFDPAGIFNPGLMGA